MPHIKLCQVTSLLLPVPWHLDTVVIIIGSSAPSHQADRILRFFFCTTARQAPTATQDLVAFSIVTPMHVNGFSFINLCPTLIIITSAFVFEMYAFFTRKKTA